MVVTPLPTIAVTIALQFVKAAFSIRVVASGIVISRSARQLAKALSPIDEVFALSFTDASEEKLPNNHIDIYQQSSGLHVDRNNPANLESLIYDYDGSLYCLHKLETA